MSILDDVIVRTVSGMSAGEQHDLIITVVDRMLAQMSAPDRRAVMEHVVDHFLDALPAEERTQTVRELVPRLMSQLLRSGGMSVDDFLMAAIGSLTSLERESIAREGSDAEK